MAESRQPRAATASTDTAGNTRLAGRYLTIEELSLATTLSVSTLRRLMKRGAIVGHQPGGPRTRIVFRPDAIEQASGAATPSVEQPAPKVGDAPPRGLAPGGGGKPQLPNRTPNDRRDHASQAQERPGGGPLFRLAARHQERRLLCRRPGSGPVDVIPIGREDE